MPYVSNEERIRLGLQRWGSDVPQAALDAALAAAEGAAAAPPAEDTPAEAPKRKRARTRRGRYYPDDPTTPDVNEAYEAS